MTKIFCYVGAKITGPKDLKYRNCSSKTNSIVNDIRHYNPYRNIYPVFSA